MEKVFNVDLKLDGEGKKNYNLDGGGIFDLKIKMVMMERVIIIKNLIIQMVKVKL